MKKVILAIALGLAMPMAAIAAEKEGLTPERYILIEMDTRTATLEGMMQRLELLKSDPENLEAQYLLDEQVRQKVNAAYSSRGTTANEHLAWYDSHYQAVEQWLARNPQSQALLDRIGQQFKALSEQISGLRGTN
ncbi:hypothetical protein [Endozoicomonas sp. ALB115]|uniref:hypothetical protein n=1 Tax=Endozoicomonas TaxID=305899 RepID=UPI003BB63DAD